MFYTIVNLKRSPDVPSTAHAHAIKSRDKTADKAEQLARDCAALARVQASRPSAPPNRQLAERRISAGAIAAAREARQYGKLEGLHPFWGLV